MAGAKLFTSYVGMQPAFSSAPIFFTLTNLYGEAIWGDYEGVFTEPELGRLLDFVRI